ncbi:MAG: hypothetical protein HZB18_05500 [Chloroflexi bacterium]|nr:hypothetical protein [Chloroflexota bacterium]
MQKPSEEQRAKAAYNWLRASPILTVSTFLLIAGMDFASYLCNGTCSYKTTSAINYMLGILFSALWHLLLLQYANDRESEFVRKHGRRALASAGIRTAVPLGAALVDYSVGAGGLLACWSIPVLIILWGGNTKTGLQEIAKELGGNEPAVHPQPAKTTQTSSNNFISMKENAMPENDSRSPEEILNELYAKLQSDDDVAVLHAISALRNINFSSEAIRRQLEKISLSSDSPQVRKDALAALDLPSQRNIRKRQNTLQRSERNILVREINAWEKDGLFGKQTLDVIRRRYDFDFTPPPPSITAQDAPRPAPVPMASPPPMKAVQPVQMTTPLPAQAKVTPAPKPVAPPKPKQPPIDWKKLQGQLADAASSGALLRALLYLGAFMIVISATVLVVRFWNVFNPILQLIFIASVPLIFYVGGWTLRTRLKLTQAGTVLTGIGAVLVAVDFAAIYQLGGLAGNVNGSVYWLFVAVFCTALYAFTTWKMQGEFFDYLTLLAGAGAVFALASLIQLPVEWQVVSVTFSAAMMTGVTARFWQAGEHWRELARASRYLSQILIPASVFFIIFSNASLPIMAAFLLATIAYCILAWKFPKVVFAYSALGASIGTVLFALRAVDMSPQWYATVGSVLALAYILIGQLVKRSKIEPNIIQSYAQALNTTGFILVGLATMDGFILAFNETTFWSGVLALAISSLDLAVCAYLFQHSRYTLLASGLVIVPFTLAIGRWLNDAQTAQGLTWLTVAWGALALSYIGAAALLQKADHHARWLYVWAHMLIPFALFFIYLDYLTTNDWVNTSALVSLGICISGYALTFILQDGGKHPPLSAISNSLPSGLGKGIFLWPIGLLLPIFASVAWHGTQLPREWFGTTLAGFALAYLGAGQLLFKRAKEYRFPLHVFVYLLCFVAIPSSSADRYALLTSLLVTVTSAGILAYLYNRVVETVIASLLFIWPFQLLLGIFKVEAYSQALGYVLLASLAYIPIAIYLNTVRKSDGQSHHTPLFLTGYAMTVYAIAASLIGRASTTFAPWVGMAIPLIAAALYTFSVSYFKSSKFSTGWAWAGALTFAIAFGQSLTLFKVPAGYDALAWVGLAVVYMLVERILAQIPETGTGKIERNWFEKFHWPLITGILVLSTLGLMLSLPDTFTAFAGNQPANYQSPILAQLLLVILSIASARLYQQRWPLFIEPFLAFLPATLFFIGYGEKIFLHPLSTPQFALIWSGLGVIHLSASAFIDRAKIRYAHGLYLGAYILLTWAVLWSVLNRATFVWSFGLWILALVTSAVLVHFGRHQTWDEFIQLIFEKSKGRLRTTARNAFQWLAAFAFPIWLTLFLRQINVQADFAWLALVVAPLAYLWLALWLRNIDLAYTSPLHSSAQFFTVIGLLISAPTTINFLGSFSGGNKNTFLAFIILQAVAVVFYAASSWMTKARGYAHVSAWLSIIPFTMAWKIFGITFTPIRFVVPWLIWSTVLLAIGFALDRNKTRYSHGPYFAGYALAAYALTRSVPDRVSNIYALAIIITLALISHLLVHFGRHHSFEDFVGKFWQKADETTQRIVSTIFLFLASYAAPVLLAQTLTHLKLDLAVRGVSLAIAAPLFIAIGLAVRNAKSRSIVTVPTWPLYSTGYALTAIGAMISFGDERLAIYVLVLNTVVYAVSAYIFQQAFWLYLSTVLTPLIGLLILHNTDRLETKWAAWIFIGLAYLYLLVGQIFDRTKKTENAIHPFAAPFYAPGFLLSAIALAISSSDKMLALQIYSAGVLLYAIAGWLFREALFIYPSAWLATVPYYLLITLTKLDVRWYGLACLPLITLYTALGRFVFHKRPLPPVGKGVLAEWLSHPATPLYLLAYSLSVSMISLSYISPLSLTLAFSAAAVIYFVSAYLFRAPSWIYAGLFATHMAVLAFFTISPSGRGIQYITLPFLAMTWLTALFGYGFSRRITEPDSEIKNEAFKFSLTNRLFGHPWSRPFFAFAIAEMFIWQTVAMKGCDTTIILGSGHALLLALFSLLWAEGVLVYGVVGFSLLAIGAWMKQSGIEFTNAVAIYGGIGFGLYLFARLLEPLSARLKALTVWLTPLTYSAITLTALSAIINLPFVVNHMTATAASLAFAGALYTAIAYRGRRYQLGYLGMALLEVAWAMALYMSDVIQPQWYAIPGGLYFMGLAYLEWLRNRSKYAIGLELLGLGILLITSFTQSLNGSQGFAYFVLLMAESLLIIWWGTIQKRKIPFFVGIIFSALNIIAQVIVLVNVYNISIWLVGLGMGLVIMGIAVFVELRREQLRARTREWSETLEKWE